MELKDIKSVYFVGIGGIGMSAIARYFLHMGVPVGGYDKTPSALTAKLEEEGAQIHYEDDLTEVPQIFLSPESTLVVSFQSHRAYAFLPSWIHGAEACSGSGHLEPEPAGTVRGRYAWQDHHQQHGGSYSASESC